MQDLMEFDTAYSVAGVGRYRVNVYRQRGTLALALRSIPLQIPTFEQLGSPAVVQSLCELERGLLLVVGAAGNGKSSTLAAMIGYLNQTRRVHIVTIEDPIEFLHQDALSTISQREIGPRHTRLPDRAARRAAPGPGRDLARRGARRESAWTSRSRRRRPATWCWRRCTRPTSRARSAASSR